MKLFFAIVSVPCLALIVGFVLQIRELVQNLKRFRSRAEFGMSLGEILRELNEPEPAMASSRGGREYHSSAMNRRVEETRTRDAREEEEISKRIAETIVS